MNRVCYNRKCKFCVAFGVCAIDKQNCDDYDTTDKSRDKLFRELNIHIERDEDDE